ncbi:MAG: hypothetical protein ACOZBL_02870 [Patescibacteria group bacterium]
MSSQLSIQFTTLIISFIRSAVKGVPFVTAVRAKAAQDIHKTLNQIASFFVFLKDIFYVYQIKLSLL